MAESNNGEIDAYITPAGISNSDNQLQDVFLNFTAIQRVVGDNKYNLSPRKVFCGTEISKNYNREKE